MIISPEMLFSRNARCAFLIQVSRVSASFKHGITTDTSTQDRSLSLFRFSRAEDCKLSSDSIIASQSLLITIPGHRKPRGSLLWKKDGAESVNIEVYKRNIGRPVVRRLGGTMNDPVKAVRLEEVKYLLTRATVQVQMGEAPGHFLEMTKPPGGITRGAKELLAHVVVYPEYDMASSIEVLNGLGADQSAATGK